jgi:hypothetical protein
MSVIDIVSVAGALGVGAIIKALIDRVLSRRGPDAMKVMLETLTLATQEIATLRADLAKAHDQLSQVSLEVISLRSELAGLRRANGQ